MIYLRLAAIAVVALALYGAYWSIDNGGYQRGATEVQGRWDESIQKAKDDQAKRIKTAQEKDNEYQAAIARLAADARRVRVKFPVCSTDDGGENSDGIARPLSDRVDEEFDAFRGEVGQLIERCERLNADAIRQNSSLPD